MTYSVKADFIKPFLIATMKVLGDMDGVDNIRRGKPCLKSTPNASGLLSGIVDLSGDDLTGSYALTFSPKFATALCTKLFQNEVHARNGDEVKKRALTTAAELAQKVCHRAGVLLADQDLSLRIASPRGIVGKRHRLKHALGKPAVQIPFVSTWGTFYMEASFCVAESIHISQMPPLLDIDTCSVAAQ